MKSKAPPSRRKFADAWDEIDYLYHKLLYWLYDRGDPRKAQEFCDRLEQLLDRESPGVETVRGEECRSLISEARGDLGGAIAHREREIRLMKRLLEAAMNSPGKDYVLRNYNYGDLSDRLDLLAVLYHDTGDLDRAIATLQESRQLCLEHRGEFDGQDVLEEYLCEKEATLAASENKTQETHWVLLWVQVSPFYRVRDSWRTPWAEAKLIRTRDVTPAFTAYSPRKQRAIALVQDASTARELTLNYWVEIVGRSSSDPEGIRELVIRASSSADIAMQLISLMEEWVIWGKVSAPFQGSLSSEQLVMSTARYLGVPVA
jgi:tetratricopeptide (TPR) repeat protein